MNQSDNAQKGLNPCAWMADRLQDLEDNDLLRRLPTAEPLPGGKIRLDGRELLDFCSNDYLGLMQDLTPPVAAAGATASRSICGNHPSIIGLEADLADLHETEAALALGSGFLANSGAVSTLVGRGDAIYADRLNHASLVDGAQLSHAKHLRYHHNDLDHLEELLQKGEVFRRRLIVTDAVFSMDGDCADLARLVELKTRYNAMLMVDEAHSDAVLGPEGRGLAAAVGVEQQVDIHVGTLSKGYGCYGAFITGSQMLIDYLINRMRTLIYSTGMPPIMADLARQAVALARAADDRRSRLADNAEYLRNTLLAAGVDIGTSTTHIVPVITGSSASARDLGGVLAQAGIAAVAIRPPTVPREQARVRLSVSAAHGRTDIDAVADAAIRWSMAKQGTALE